MGTRAIKLGSCDKHPAYCLIFVTLVPTNLFNKLSGRASLKFNSWQYAGCLLHAPSLEGQFNGLSSHKSSSTILQGIYKIQKKTVRIMTFSKYFYIYFYAFFFYRE